MLVSQTMGEVMGMIELAAKLLQPLPLGVTIALVAVAAWAYRTNKGEHRSILDVVQRVEKRSCAHTSVIAKKLDIGYDEILRAEQEAGVNEPKGGIS